MSKWQLNHTQLSQSIGDWCPEPLVETKIHRHSSFLYKMAKYNKYSWLSKPTGLLVFNQPWIWRTNCIVLPTCTVLSILRILTHLIFTIASWIRCIILSFTHEETLRLAYDTQLEGGELGIEGRQKLVSGSYLLNNRITWNN